MVCYSIWGRKIRVLASECLERYFRNGLMLPGNELLKALKALATRKTGTACEAPFWGVRVSPAAAGAPAPRAWINIAMLRLHVIH